MAQESKIEMFDQQWYENIYQKIAKESERKVPGSLFADLNVKEGIIGLLDSHMDDTQAAGAKIAKIEYTRTQPPLAKAAYNLADRILAYENQLL